MGVKSLLIILVFSLSLTACGQTTQSRNQPSTNKKTEIEMDLSKITNATVKSAIEAFQANNINAWYAHFTNNAVFTDDGRTLDLKSFFDNTFEKKRNS